MYSVIQTLTIIILVVAYTPRRNLRNVINTELKKSGKTGLDKNSRRFEIGKPHTELEGKQTEVKHSVV